MDGPSKGSGPNGRSSTGTAVEVDAAEKLRGEEGPGMVRRRVGVVEGNAVEVDVIVAVREAAKISFRLAETDAVTVEGKGSRGHLYRLAVVGNWRSKVLDKGLADLGTRRASFEQSVHRGKRSSDRA